MDTLHFSQYLNEQDFPISVAVMKRKKHKGVVPLHSHEFSELAIVAEGQVCHHCGIESTLLKKGDFFLIHPGTLHAYSDLRTDTVVYNLIYDSRIPIPMLMTSGLPLLEYIYPPSETPSGLSYSGVISRLSKSTLLEVQTALLSIRRENRSWEPGHYILTISLFMEVILRLSRYYRQKAPDTIWALNKVIAYQGCHLAESITNKSLATIAGMSESTLLRNFKSSFGIGQSEYLADLRVCHAVQLLKNTRLTLDDIATQSGFFDSSHMWKTFHKKLHYTPKEIRDAKGQNLPDHHQKKAQKHPNPNG